MSILRSVRRSAGATVRKASVRTLTVHSDHLWSMNVSGKACLILSASKVGGFDGIVKGRQGSIN